MDFKLTRDQKRLRREILRFAQEQMVEEDNQPAAYSKNLWKKCSAQKITGLHIPELYGGRGLDLIDTALAMEGLGAGGSGGDILRSLSSHLFSVVTPLLEFGNETQKRTYLPNLASGALIGASAMAELTTGTWNSNISTMAKKEGDSYVLRGKKSFSINAPEANIFLIYATNEQDKERAISCFIVPADTPGLHVAPVSKAIVPQDTPVGDVHLDDVHVPVSALLGEAGQGTAIYQRVMAWERCLMSSVYVGWLEKLVDLCIQEARIRKQGDVPIGKRQSVSHPIADMKIRLEVSRLLSRKSAWALALSPSDSAIAATSKLFSSESMTKSALDTIQIFGDYGVFNEFQFSSTLQNALDSHFLGGSAQAQRMSIAKALGL